MECSDNTLDFCPVCMGSCISSCEPEKLPTVVSIAEVNGKVIIALDNGKYLNAEMSVIDKNLITGGNFEETINSLKERLRVLEEKEDKDTIFDPTELNNKISELENKLSKLTDNIIDIHGLDGELSHLAINKTYKD